MSHGKDNAAKLFNAESKWVQEWSQNKDRTKMLADIENLLLL